MVDLDHSNVVVLVFGMEGCGACEHYIPRLVAEAEALRQAGYPIVVNPSGQLPPNAVPVMIYDAASPDGAVQRLADRFVVSATPSTIVACRGPGSFKCEGSLANNQIQWLLLMACDAAAR